MSAYQQSKGNYYFEINEIKCSNIISLCIGKVFDLNIIITTFTNDNDQNTDHIFNL